MPKLPPLCLVALAAAGALSAGCQSAYADLPVDAGSVQATSTSSGGSPSSGSSSGTSGGDDGSGDDDASPGDDAAPGEASNGEAGSPEGSALAEGDAGDATSPGSGDDSSSSPESMAMDAASDGLVCANLACTTFLDCLFEHSAQVTPCGFTVCVSGVCQ
jgi:hypothetical protein